MLGYSVSFFPGSSGRFLSNILYCLLNDLELDLSYDERNSSHNTTYYKSNFDISLIPALEYGSKSNHVQLFKYLCFLPMDTISVLPTHAYPLSELLEKNPYTNTFKMVIIEVSENNLVEINTNSVIKNTWPLLDKLKTEGFDKLSDSENGYMNEFIKSLAEFKINLLQLKSFDTIERYARLVSNKQKNTEHMRFINPKIDPKYVDKTLILKYDDIFAKTNTGYKGLDILQEWVGKKGSDTLLQNYSLYVEGRNKLIKSIDYLK